MKFLTLFALLLSFGVFASDENRKLDTQALKDGCAKPSTYGNQIPPSEIKIHCVDQRRVWVATNNEDAQFRNSRVVCASAHTNKPNLGVQRHCVDCAHMPTAYQCGGFKEVQENVEMEFSVTCDQIMEMKTIDDFCIETVGKQVAENEKILEVKDTGRSKRVCGIEEFMNGKPVNSDR
jgi:hypothetical protein